MPIITGRGEVEDTYRSAASRSWLVPTFCAENQTTIEAILAACQDKAELLGERVPITVAITGRYPHRAQATHYAGSRNWRTGLQLFLGDCQILARPDGDYPDVDVLVHLDHGQPDLDEEVLAGDLSAFSSIMFDASALPWAENLSRTAEFVAARRSEVLIEGACDEIVDAGGAAANRLTSPERATEFLETTEVDMMVANLGTEHRSAASDLQYYPEAARAISAVTGAKLVLHGATSVPRPQLESLFSDGVCKVNIWTILERDSSSVLLEQMAGHALDVAGPQTVTKLRDAGLLGPQTHSNGLAQIDYFTTAWRRDVVHQSMRQIILAYLDLWYR